MNKKQKKMLARILTAAALLAGLNFVPVTGLAKLGLYLIPYLIIGYDILLKALKGIRNRQVFDENFLMAVATARRDRHRSLRAEWGLHGSHRGHAVLSGWRTVPELRGRKKPAEHQ